MARRSSPSRSQRRRRKRKQVGLSGLLLFLFLAMVCTAAVYWASRVFLGERAPERETPPPQTADTPSGSEPPPQVYEDFTRAPETETPEPPPEIAPGDGARVALVIDDLGRSLEDLDRLAALGVPLTYAVLPFETRTPEVVAALRRDGREILLHLPMEPANGADPGPGALTRAMGRRELVRATRAALAAVPGAVGVNNHMGSRLTADRGSMRMVMDELRQRDLLFLDSKTTSFSVGIGAPTRWTSARSASDLCSPVL